MDTYDKRVHTILRQASRHQVKWQTLCAVLGMGMMIDGTGLHILANPSSVAHVWPLEAMQPSVHIRVLAAMGW